MTERQTLFADVLLPVPMRQVFTYRVPFEFNELIRSGLRVLVPFGKNKILTGLVTNVHQNVPQNYQAKYIDTILDDYPIITGKQLAFWDWVSSYYMAPIGDVMNAALPANFKLASESKFCLHPDAPTQMPELSTRAAEIIELLEVQQQMSSKEIAERLGIKTIQPYLKKLLELKLIAGAEEVQERYTPKTQLFLFLQQDFQQEEQLSAFLNILERKPRTEKQVQALLRFIQLATESGGLAAPVSKTLMLKHEVSSSAIATLEKQGIFQIERLQVDRHASVGEGKGAFKPLTEVQLVALNNIEKGFEQKEVCLFYGVTGSGKTEIYVQLIQQYLDLGKQVLFLIPEIALTTQLIGRLQHYFGDLVGVYHSRFNQNERIEIWNHVLANDPHKFRIIVGARSSVFLPFADLGLVIVDEEHEASFKQYDPSPRYNARDAAIVLAKLHDAKVLLGSATPSLESYHNAKQGKYHLVQLSDRYKGLQLPLMICADLKREKRLKNMQSHFSSLMLDEMKSALAKKEQVILFQNRRGYTPIWSCEVCAWTPRCLNCDVSLTYHKHSNTLKCHYCSFTTPPIGSCTNCGSNRLRMIGFGTEKIEDELQLLFPNTVFKRMDLDSTRSKNAYEEIIDDFSNRRIDVLIGTQMVTKGLDFDHVTMVGILDADMLLNRPDFRAYERAFQLMSQVAGRAGRKEKQGKVVIQSAQAEHWVLERVMAHDFIGFYEVEIEERERFFYPPFYKIIQLTLKHEKEELVQEGAQFLADQLRNVFKERVLGPEFPIIKRIQNKFLKEIKLKIERGAPDKKVKARILQDLDTFYQNVRFKGIQISIDVDPM
jgi:primosomal protein N' (replication factor Y) (superfamily II helicase)